MDQCDAQDHMLEACRRQGVMAHYNDLLRKAPPLGENPNYSLDDCRGVEEGRIMAAEGGIVSLWESDSPFLFNSPGLFLWMKRRCLKKENSTRLKGQR